MGKWLLYYPGMGKIYTGDGWIIKVQGNEHQPVRAEWVRMNEPRS